MAINLKAITSCIGYQQITSLSASSALTVPTVDANGLSCKPTLAIITLPSSLPKHRVFGGATTAWPRPQRSVCRWLRA